MILTHLGINMVFAHTSMPAGDQHRDIRNVYEKGSTAKLLLITYVIPLIQRSSTPLLTGGGSHITAINPEPNRQFQPTDELSAISLGQEDQSSTDQGRANSRSGCEGDLRRACWEAGCGCFYYFHFNP
jgi:hypothetical protein